MSRFLTLGFMLVAVSVSAQVRPPTAMYVTIRHADLTQRGAAFMGLQDTSTEMFVGSKASVVSRPAVAGAPVSVSSFGIGAWKEGDKARVIVYAIMSDPRAPKKQTETPIATFTLSLGQSRELTETEPWGAAPVLVSASVRPVGN